MTEEEIQALIAERDQLKADNAQLEEKINAAGTEIETRKGEVVALRSQVEEANKLTDVARNELANAQLHQKYGSQTPPDLRTNVG
jgi:hypothetical protein